MKKIKSLSMGILVGLSLCAFVGYLSGTSFATQVDFPKKPITIVVNLAPGGGRDILSRGIGKAMSKYLGVPIVILNVPGAGGVLGMNKAYQSAPDGYIITAVGAKDIINQMLEKTEYDLKKCISIGRIASNTGVVFVRSDSPFNSVKDLKKFGKPIRFSAFAYNSMTLGTMIIANQDNFPLKIIGGFPGAPAAALALLRGDVEISTMWLSNIPELVRAGKLRPILIVGPKRLRALPETPTGGEMGYPDLDVFASDTWFATPPGVPKARVKILEDAFTKSLKDPEIVKWGEQLDLDLAWLSAEDTTKLVNESFQGYEKYLWLMKKYME